MSEPKALILKRRHLGSNSECFSIVPISDPPTSSLLTLQVLCFSIDPRMTVWITGAETYYPKLEIGEIMHCFSLSVVL
jgi:NADPH-dependent curcumin reductase CurA